MLYLNYYLLLILYYIMISWYILIIEDVQPWSARASFQRGGLKYLEITRIHTASFPFTVTGAGPPSALAREQNHRTVSGCHGLWLLRPLFQIKNKCVALKDRISMSNFPSNIIDQRNSVLKASNKATKKTIGLAMPAATQQHSSA